MKIYLLLTLIVTEKMKIYFRHNQTNLEIAKLMNTENRSNTKLHKLFD